MSGGELLLWGFPGQGQLGGGGGGLLEDSRRTSAEQILLFCTHILAGGSLGAGKSR